MGAAPATDENHEMGVLPQFFADRFGWQDMTQAVTEVYEGLPEEDRRECAIFCGNYGEAGAIMYYGRGRNLPPVISAHNNFYLWGPGDRSGNVLILVGVSEAGLDEEFEAVERAAVLQNGYVMPYENRPILVVRGMKAPMADLWRQAKNYN